MFKSLAPYGKKVRQWKQLCEAAPLDTRHVCTELTCADSIDTIDEDYDVYGCKESGTVHICQGNVQTCTATIHTYGGELACLFSRRILTDIWKNHPIEEISREAAKKMQLVSDTIEIWMQERKECGLDSRDANHDCSKADCHMRGDIRTISERLHLYGCLKGGVYHICEVDPKKCPATFLTSDGDYVCLYSGATLGVLQEFAEYGKPDVGYSTSSDYERPSEFEEDIQDLMEETSRNSVDAIAHLGLYDEEEERKAKNVRAREDIRVEFFESSSARKSAFRKRQREAPVEMTGKRIADMQKTIGSIVCDLLFNHSERYKLELGRIVEAERKLNEVLKKVYKRHKRNVTRPSMHELQEESDLVMHRKKKISTNHYDDARARKYQRIIFGLWNICLYTDYYRSNRTRFNVKKHCLGVLYMFMEPFVTRDENGDEIVLLKRDEYLARNLPELDDLRKIANTTNDAFGYTSRDVTTGRNNFKRAFTSIKDEEKRKEAILRIQALGR